MRRALGSRIEQLERAAPTPQPKVLVWDEHWTAEFLRKRRLADYEPKDREALLTLEERLAIARRDAVATPEAWEDRWHPQLGRVVSQLVPIDRCPAIAARELEIMILERDGAIDVDAARRLRTNIHGHYYAEPFGSVELLALPCPIVIADEDAVADEALRKCPLFESLPLEEQLQIREDQLRERRRQALIDHPPGSIEKIRADLGATRIDWDERQVAELRQKIAERDRSSRPSQKETSATA